VQVRCLISHYAEWHACSPIIVIESIPLRVAPYTLKHKAQKPESSQCCLKQEGEGPETHKLESSSQCSRSKCCRVHAGSNSLPPEAAPSIPRDTASTQCLLGPVKPVNLLPFGRRCGASLSRSCAA
jgi:hypothetical protein